MSQPRPPQSLSAPQAGEPAAPTQPLASDEHFAAGQWAPAETTRRASGRIRRAGWLHLVRLVGRAAYGFRGRSTNLPPNAALVAALTQRPLSLGVLRVVRAPASPQDQPFGDPTPGARDLETLLADGAYVYAITERVTTIGRSSENMLITLDPTVSREHAILRWRAGAWEVENLAERNRLWVNGQPVAPGAHAPFAPGDLLRLGNTSFALVAPKASADASPEEIEIPSVTTTPSTSTPTGGAHWFGAGVTLRFALVERFSPRMRWALALTTLAIFAVCALLTLGVVLLVGQDALASGGWRQALAALTLPLIPALGVAAVVFLLDRYEREPVLTLLGAFLWGAVIAIPPALFIEQQVSAALIRILPALLNALHATGALPAILVLSLAQAANAGVTEEVIKGAGLLLLLLVLRDEFDNVTDGLIYGALIGAGFAMVENIVYFAVSPRADLAILVVGRVALGWLSHSTFTALFGAGLGYLRERRSVRWQWLAPLGGLLAAILLHTYFDVVAFFAAGLAQTPAALPALANNPTLVTLVALLADYAPLFAVQLLLLRLALRALQREAEIVRMYLADEVAQGIVTPDEYVLLQDATLRSNAERLLALLCGVRAYLTARALYQTETGLAFRRWHVAQGDAPKRGPRQPEDLYRSRIPRLRHMLERRVAARLLISADRTQR